MPSYVIADNISGVIRGMTTAADPVSACRLFDFAHGDRDRVYEQHGARSRSANATASAYAVYEASGVPRDLPSPRGATADQVDGLTKVAVVVVRDATSAN